MSVIAIIYMPVLLFIVLFEQRWWRRSVDSMAHADADAALYEYHQELA